MRQAEHQPTAKLDHEDGIDISFTFVLHSQFAIEEGLLILAEFDRAHGHVGMEREELVGA